MLLIEVRRDKFEYPKSFDVIWYKKLKDKISV